MIIQLWNLIGEITDVADKTTNPKKIAGYVVVCLIIGISFSIFTSLSQVPVLSVVPILFGFGINALVLLSNSSDQYCRTDHKRGEELSKYYKKSLEMTIHTLGVGILTIIITSIYNLFPNLTIVIYRINFSEAIVFFLTTYFIVTLTLVVYSLSELVHMNVEMDK